jgi:hypothetical protein
MAVVQVLGANVTNYEAGTSDTTWIAQGLIKSGLKVWSDTYTTIGSESATSTIQLATLPTGAIVHGIIASWADIGAATATIDIGDSDDVNRYATALDIATAGSSSAIEVTGQQYAIGTNTGDTDVIATVNVADIDAIGDLKLSVLYTN